MEYRRANGLSKTQGNSLTAVLCVFFISCGPHTLTGNTAGLVFLLRLARRALLCGKQPTPGVMGGYQNEQ